MQRITCASLFLLMTASNAFGQMQRAASLEPSELPLRQPLPDLQMDFSKWAGGPPAPIAPTPRAILPPGATVSVDELRIPSSARKEWLRFQQSMKAGNLQDSVKHLSRVVQIYPQLAAAHQNLGACYVRLGEYETAVGEFQKASVIDPQMIQPQLGLAGTYLVLRRYGDAEEASRRVLGLEPQNVMGRMLLGRALASGGKDTPELEQLLRESFAYDPGAHLAFAHVLLNRGERDEAAQQLREYVRQGQLTQQQKNTFQCMIEKLTPTAAQSACVLNPASVLVEN